LRTIIHNSLSNYNLHSPIKLCQNDEKAPFELCIIMIMPKGGKKYLIFVENTNNIEITKTFA